MLDEYESNPKDLVENREVLLDALKEMNIEPESLREIVANLVLGEPLLSDLPECPDVTKQALIALWISRSKNHDLKQFVATLKLMVKLFKNKEEAQQFEDYIDALLSKPFVKPMID